MAHVVDEWNSARPYLEALYPVHQERALRVSVPQKEQSRGVGAGTSVLLCGTTSLVGFGGPDAPTPVGSWLSGTEGFDTH